MSNQRNVVHIINFIRGVEPRLPIDLTATLQEEIALVNQYGLPATWLIQYDALIDPTMMAILRDQLDGKHEFGIWFEVVQPLVERAGLTWRGRYPWDWHAHVGFSIGYTPQERERLADIVMETFREQWGAYPRSVGSWFMDAHLLGYLYDKYDIVASCNCKDQWGTDGYTLWGGYYNQAYYPSRSNGFMPAQHAEEQIPVPVFRMLGSDPIYQYDAADLGHGQTVITLEPVYTGEMGGGGNPEWVRWFFETNFTQPPLSFGYTQIGQENSFGWDRIAAGLTDQIALTAAEQHAGRIRVETLAESGEWFKERYPLTPASSILALEDWRATGKQSLWFYNRYYRANLLREGSRFRIRDLHRFDEQYAERYLNQVCEGEECCYDTLPVMDGGRWMGDDTDTGIWPVLLTAEGQWEALEIAALENVKAEDESLSCTLVSICGAELELELRERTVKLSSTSGQWGLRWIWGAAATEIVAQAGSIAYRHEGFAYQVQIDGQLSACQATRGNAPASRQEFVYAAQQGKLTMTF